LSWWSLLGGCLHLLHTIIVLHIRFYSTTRPLAAVERRRRRRRRMKGLRRRRRSDNNNN